MAVKKSQEKLIEEVLTKQIDKIYPSREALEKVLKSGEKLTIYWGIDPTSPHVHLGHSTNLFVLRRFQKLGHKVIGLIGDYTARIGDPSGKDTKRMPLSRLQIANNLKNYKSQILKILDPKKTVFRYNSEWWNKMKASDLLMLDSLVTHQQIIERDMFQKRIADGNPISEMEIQYPLLQGYDSVALKTDVEIGGTDQLFNMLMGRNLEKTLLKKEKFIITTPLLENPKTGKKLMSKSEGSYISMDDEPNDTYGKVMALIDDVILTCFKFCTDLDDDRIKDVETRLKNKENPKNLKSELASEIVKIYHGEKKAKEAAEEFERVFRKHELPEDIPKCPGYPLKGRWGIIDLIVHAYNIEFSRTQVRRLVFQRAVKINGEIVDDPFKIIDVDPMSKLIIQVGPIHFVKIK